MNSKFTGDLESYRNSYVGMVNSMEKKFVDKIAASGKIYAPDTKQGQKAFKSVTPKTDAPVVDWKLKYK